MGWNTGKMGLRVKKTLLGPAEKAQIVSAMRTSPHIRNARSYAMEFKRLPATIVKIAAEAGVYLAHD
jgi:hypothetical protein